MIRFKLCILFLVFISCTEKKVIVYENEKTQIFGTHLAIQLSNESTLALEELTTFEELEIRGRSETIKDSIDGVYALKQDRKSATLYLLDTFPVGKNWKNELVEVLSWNLGVNSSPTQILNHSRISNSNIDDLITETEEFKVNKKELSSQETTTLLKKLYILNLRCCLSTENEKHVASELLYDFQNFVILDSLNKQLQNQLVSYLQSE